MWLPSFFLLLVCTSVMAQFEDIEHWLKHVDLKALKAALKHADEPMETSAGTGVNSEFEDIEHCLKLVDFEDLKGALKHPNEMKEKICPGLLGAFDCMEKYVHESVGISIEMFAALFELEGDEDISNVKRFLNEKDRVKGLCKDFQLKRGVKDEIAVDDIQHCMELSNVKELLTAIWTHPDQLKTNCLAMRDAFDCIEKLIHQSIGLSVEKFANFLEVKDEKHEAKVVKSLLKIRNVIIKDLCADDLQSNKGSKEDVLVHVMDFLGGLQHCNEIAEKLRAAIKSTDGPENICRGMLLISGCYKKLIEKVPVELLAQSKYILREIQKKVDFTEQICQ